MPKEVRIYLFCRTQCNAMQHFAQASLSGTSSTDPFLYILLPVLDRQGDLWALTQLHSPGPES